MSNLRVFTVLVMENLRSTPLFVVLFCLLFFSTQHIEAQQIFTHPPCDINKIKGVLPLGNVSPGSEHLLPVDHMYLRFKNPPWERVSIPLYNMGRGSLVMAMRNSNEETPDSYQLYIRHNRFLTSYIDYVYELTDELETYLNSTGQGWQQIGDTSSKFIILGQRGAPKPLKIRAGYLLGKTRNYNTDFDIGVIDSRIKAKLLGRGPRRYPTIKDFLRLLDCTDIQEPFRGQQTKNAASFLSYMPQKLRKAWFKLILSKPKQLGQTGWDLNGKLRGNWFNPQIDNLNPPPLFELEYGAISITPYNLEPNKKVQIAIAQGHPLAALDPIGVHPQLAKAFIVDMNRSTKARVNPNPANVGQKNGTVCYDLIYNQDSNVQYNSLLLRMVTRKKVAVSFDPTPHNSSTCAARLSEQGDSNWIIYVR